MIKFYRGLKDSYSIAAHGSDIYFATDTLEILHGGNSYSGLHQETKSIIDIDVVDGIINITYTDNSTNKIDITDNWSLIATHTSDITQLKETDKSLDDRLIIIEGNFKDGKLDIDLTPITELLTDHSTRIETLENSSVAKDTFEAYKSSTNTTFATKTSVNNKVDKVSGKQLSTNDFTNELKTKLENSNIYKHQFRTFSALPASGDGWYSIVSIGDTESSIVQISSGGHSDVQVAINTGWSGNTTGSLTVLNSFIDDTNDNHAYVKAVRLRKIPNSNNGTAVLEAKINRTDYYTYTLYVNIVVSVFTNAGHNIITTNSENSQALLLVNDDSNIIQEFTLTDKAIMAKNIVAETITADNLQNYKTKQSAKSSPTASSSTDYLFIDTITQNANGEITATKKTVRSASQSQSGLMSASDKTKLDSFQSADTYATKEQITSINLVSWSVLDLFNGYEYVDLGLPSGTLWAKCNIGALKESDCGLYFQWGDVVGYKNAISGNRFIWSDYKYCNGSNTTLTKYNNNSSYGTVDNLTTIELSDDAASVNMGGNWRMPSKEEYQELIDNTTNAWTTVNEVKGILFTSKTNNNTLFFPASGNCISNKVYDVNTYGYSWSSSLDTSAPNTAHCLSFTSNKCSMYNYNRYYGRTVRGVINLNN